MPSTCSSSMRADDQPPSVGDIISPAKRGNFIHGGGGGGGPADLVSYNQRPLRTSTVAILRAPASRIAPFWKPDVENNIPLCPLTARSFPSSISTSSRSTGRRWFLH